MEGCQMSCSFYGCKRTYNSPEALNSHQQDHQKNPAQSLPGKLFLCSSIGCDGSFSNMQQLMEHMRHHHKPNYYFLCESCKAKLRSYRTLLKHLQTCAKVAKNKAAKTETGMAPDTDPNGVSLTTGDMELSGSFLDTNGPEEMESKPSLPTYPTTANIPVTQQSPANNDFMNPTSAGPATLPLATLEPALTQNLSYQPESPYSPFPPTLSPVNPAFLPDPGQQQQRTPRSGPPSLPSSPTLPSSPGSNAVWRKNQDPPGPLLHRWNSPSRQSLSRDEVQAQCVPWVCHVFESSNPLPFNPKCIHSGPALTNVTRHQRVCL
ncbi:zinc finger protein 414-like isoform X2 [Myxocyprinus asiaticus]|uniref:zinc finger protein 414-like isoform X2 n=1 Tax=Myxocyprinus asiaticus TaxID=70543 RepID=UPI0022227A6B|nr:zinc finger protein 414-like isoform X2 [Myxocyprinus asiaticus]